VPLSVARALLTALLLGGCAGEVIEVDPNVVLGTGEITFEPIVEGQDLEFILGPQGGYHFLASMRVQGVAAGDPADRTFSGNPTTTFTAFLVEDGSRIDLDASSYTQGLEPLPDGVTYQMVGRLLILDIRDCADLENRDVRIEVEVRDDAGVVVRDARTVRAVPSPFNRP
jgi:hypothetical protein